jgi:hypothetical protein
MLGFTVPRLLCLRQTCSTLRETATTHRTRYMRGSGRQKDAQGHEEEHKEMWRSIKHMMRMCSNMPKVHVDM